MRTTEPVWAISVAIGAPIGAWLAVLAYYAAIGAPFAALLLLPIVAVSVALSLHHVWPSRRIARAQTGETRRLHPLD